jgi:hypothetical protein
MNPILSLIATHALAFITGALVVYFNVDRIRRELSREIEDIKSIGQNLKDIVDTILHG